MVGPRFRLLALFVGVLPLAARAVVPFGPEFDVNTTTAGLQLDPDVAAASNGKFMTVWSGDSDGDGRGIFGQLYDHNGTPIGVEFQVNTYTTGAQQTPAVAADAAGRFIVVWAGFNGPNGLDVFAQRYDGNGTALGGEFQANTTVADDQGYPGVDVAAGASGDFVIAWSSYGQDGYGFAVIGRRFNSDGTPAGGEFQVNTYTTGNQGYPGVAVGKSASGSFVIAWSDEYQDGDGSGVFARHFDIAGVATTPSDVQINTYTTGDQGHGGVAAAGDGAGNFVIAWNSYDQDGNEDGVFAQRLSGGSLAGTEFQVNTYTTYSQGVEGPAVAAGPGGDFVVTWSSVGQDGSGYATMARRYHSNGTPATGEFLVNTATISQQWFPSVSIDWGECSVITWVGGQASTVAPCIVDTDCPKYPQEVCFNGFCEAISPDGDESGILGQRFCKSRPPDHYKCYRGKDLNDPTFQTVEDVSLTDQFGSQTGDVRKIFTLCTPVDKNGEGIVDPAAHLCCYKLKAKSLKPAPQVEVVSQFQSSKLEVRVPRLLCAPCTKTVLSP